MATVTLYSFESVLCGRCLLILGRDVLMKAPPELTPVERRQLVRRRKTRGA